jgi:hypothetical protein
MGINDNPHTRRTALTETGMVLSVVSSAAVAMGIITDAEPAPVTASAWLVLGILIVTAGLAVFE